MGKSLSCDICGEKFVDTKDSDTLVFHKKGIASLKLCVPHAMRFVILLNNQVSLHRSGRVKPRERICIRRALKNLKTEYKRGKTE